MQNCSECLLQIPPILFLLDIASLTHGPCQAMQEKESSENAVFGL